MTFHGTCCRLAAIVALGLLAILAKPQFAAAQDAKFHPGPAVWIEEYWDVKPEKFGEFMTNYKRDVYEYVRKIPGYRGYNVITTIPDANGNPVASNPKLQKNTSDHYGIHINGEVLTKRLYDVGNLIRRTHNVVITHSFQTWPEADAFRKTYAKMWADAHGGEDVNEHWAKALFPLSNNFWESRFRLDSTGETLPKNIKGKDADGLNLEPRVSNAMWGKEYFDVSEKEMKAFLDAYESETYQVMRLMPGYKGVTIVLNTPPTPEQAKITRYNNQPLGTEDTFYMPWKGMMMDGEMRTNYAINYSLLFNKTFTMITYYQVPWGTKMLELMQANFDKQHPGVGDRLAFITKKLFPHARNHWDMMYTGVETSFLPTGPGDVK